MKKLLVGILLVFLLSLAAASAVITTDPDISLDDIWTIDEDVESTITLESDIVGVVDYGDSVDEFDITSEGVITWTPTNDDVGSFEVTVDALDVSEAIVDSYTFTVTVENINDAPELTLDDVIEDEEYVLDLNENWEDVDNVLADLIFELVDVDSDLDVDDYTFVEGVFTLTDDVKPGVYTATFKVSDLEPLEDTKEVTFIVIDDACVCEEGEVGDLNIRDIEFDEDDFKPGETMDLNIEVENKYDEELDVEVEVYLYDLTKGKKLVEESDEQEIEDGEEETFDFELELPMEDLDPAHEYMIFVKAHEDEEDHCTMDTKELELELESHRVIIESFTLDKSTVKPGDLVEATIKVRNVGESNEDVIMKLLENDLSVDKESEEFELESYDDGDNKDSVDTQVIRFTVPTTAEAGSYSVELIVEYDDGDELENEFLPLIVSVPGSELEVKTGVLPELKTGQTYSFEVTVTNKGDSMVGYMVTVEGDWFKSAGSQIVTIDVGESATVKFDLEITESGAQTGKVIVKDDSKIVKTKDFLADVKAGGLSGITGGFAGVFKDSSAFWIIGDIVLVIIAIFFLKLIFGSGKKHQPVEEIKL